MFGPTRLQVVTTIAVAILGVSSVTAQTFSFGTALGGPSDPAIPVFDSQRAPQSGSSSVRGNPFSSFPRSLAASSSPVLSFEDFFSSSRIGSPAGRQPSSSRAASRVSPKPVITSRGSPVQAPVRQSTAVPVRQQVTPAPTPFRNQAQRVDTGRGSSSADTVRATSSLSSRGRLQEEPVRQPVTRPPSTTPVAEIHDVRDNLVGQSICARGTAGDACRQHLATTALACTSGFCRECQQCGTMSPDLWPKCCREHFLCCRPLAKACQACDRPLLAPFCGAAFGRCKA